VVLARIAAGAEVVTEMAERPGQSGQAGDAEGYAEYTKAVREPELRPDDPLRMDGEREQPLWRARTGVPSR
jgi:hypothetical protein